MKSRTLAALLVAIAVCAFATAAPRAAAARTRTIQGLTGAVSDTARTGDRVKLLLAADSISGRPRQMLFGNLVARSADSLRIDLGNGTSMISVPHRAIDKLYVSRGVPTRRRRAIGGAIGGAVAGAAFGVVLTLVSDADVWDVVQHTLLDSALGAALGGLMPQESWKRVTLRP